VILSNRSLAVNFCTKLFIQRSCGKNHAFEKKTFPYTDRTCQLRSKILKRYYRIHDAVVLVFMLLHSHTTNLTELAHTHKKSCFNVEKIESNCRYVSVYSKNLIREKSVSNCWCVNVDIDRVYTTTIFPFAAYVIISNRSLELNFCIKLFIKRPCD
jgi:hypothetical protein